MITRTQAAELAKRTAELLQGYNEALDKISEEGERAEQFKKQANAFCCELHKVRELVYKGITCEGDHHKQWYLVQIAKATGMVIDDEIEPGVTP